MRPHRFLQKKFAELAVLRTRRKVDFVVAGTQKGGTSALDVYLRMHPQIGMGDKKELHFFDEDIYFQTARPPYAKYHRHFALVRNRKIWGEATPIYMYWQAVPSRIREYNPRMKFILLLRNPVERAYSHWNMERVRKAEDLLFWEALQAEAQRLQGSPLLQNRFFSYVSRGFYSSQLERLWSFFPREQILIMKTEDLRNRPQNTLDRICHFLGVDPLPGVDKIDVHSHEYASRMGDPEKSYLKTIFETEIKKLEQLLGWDCRDWLAD